MESMTQEAKPRISTSSKGFSLDRTLENLLIEQLKTTIEELKIKLRIINEGYASLKEEHKEVKEHFKFYEDTLKSYIAHNKILGDQVIRDHLTGLYNKRHLEDEINYYTKYAERDGRPFSLLVFDVDNFKKINDKYGHSKGDVLLKSVADLVKKNIDERDLAFRYGGDEFVVLCPDTKESDAEKLADRLCKAVKKKNIGVSIKMGVSEYNKNSEMPIFDRADDLLYLASDLGKDGYVTESFAKTLR